ncbi:MAG: hypothetical protein DRP10_02665 [Candidatus Aenigmatarchaeota archaeon]|nr:MAG: hypothetical protein DRP10_02665 [Candidatus Aenigmarchaeota archaeon]
MVEEEIEKLKEKFKINFFQIEKILADYDERISNIEEYSKKREKEEDELKKELNEKLNNLIKKKEEEFEEIKNNIRERIERGEHLGSRLEEIEKLVREFDKKYEEWKVFREDLENDKNLYLELRKVVLTSIEKLKNFEKVFNENLEEFGEISKRVEENEKLYEKLSDETKRELSILSAEGKRIEQNVEEFKNKLREKLIKKFEDLDYKLENEVKTNLSRHGEILNNFGKRFLSVEQQIKNVKRDIVEKIIDEEMNKLLLILNNKLKDVVTMQDFEVIKAELRNKVEQIRKPEIKPLEERISAIEESIKELEKLLRSISQRTPVIVE